LIWKNREGALAIPFRGIVFGLTIGADVLLGQHPSLEAK
jgi:hypothetical protein